MKQTIKILIFVLLSVLSIESWAASSETNEIEIGEKFYCDIYDVAETDSRWVLVEIVWEFSDGLHYSGTRNTATNYVWVNEYHSQVYAKAKWKESDLYGSGPSSYRSKSYTWYFTVNAPVEETIVQSPIYLTADDNITINPSSQWMTIVPYYGHVNTINWTSADPSIAKIDKNTGFLQGITPGETSIYCIVNGSVRSNDAQVIVSEPTFTFNGFSLENQTNGVDTKPTITAEYSLALTRSTNFDQIALADEQGRRVDGTASISGSTLSFTPTKHLQPLSTYTLTIPKSAVKNKWGTNYLFEQKVSFATTDWKRMTLAVQPEATYIIRGDQITLSCSAPEADIFYSTDGGEPTTPYTAPLTFEQDMTLRAVARLDGYYDTEVLVKDYMQRIEIAEKFPDAEPLYNYADVNPSITFSQPFSGDLSGITLQREDMQTGTVSNLAFEPIVHDRTLYLVPAEPLQTGMTYVVTIPEGALTTAKGEPMAATEWRFTTGSYATAVSTGGPELTAALKTDGSLWTWGRRLTAANAEDGSWSYDAVTVPADFVSGNVVAVSSGYMHHALVKNDGTLWMWGRQLCGEFGNGGTTASAQPVKVMDGVRQVSCGLQTTALVKNDGTLWMSGRNDLGQIDSTRESHHEFVKVMDGVSEARLSWGSLQVVRTDGSTETRTWDATADDGREPQNNIMDGMADVQYGWHSAVALATDGGVWTWSNEEEPTEMIAGRHPQPTEGVAILGEKLILEKDQRAVVPVRPVPLQADYDALHYISSDVTVAEVSNRGVVTACSDGKVTITATLTDWQGTAFEATIDVLVGVATAIGEVLAAGNWQLQVATEGRVVSITGVPEGQAVRLFAADGRLVFSGRMNGRRLSVALPQSGVYIVRSQSQTKKIAVR